jgi:hypothetical protein
MTCDAIKKYANHPSRWMLQKLANYHNYRVGGLELLPKSGPALIVINHTMATYDSLLLMEAIFQKHQRLLRYLAHRLWFQIPGLSHVANACGAVEAHWDTSLEFAQKGELLGVAPGGLREAIKPSELKYKLLWQDRLGFARFSVVSQTPVFLAANPLGDDVFTVHSSPITDLAYQLYRFPLPVFHGRGPTPIPRQVNLSHIIAGPFLPPPAPNTEDVELCVASFQRFLLREMRKLMKRARAV